MRKLHEIIDAVKDGERPEYDELRYALLAVDFLNTDLHLFVMMDLYGKDKLTGWEKKRVEMKFDNRQKAFNLDPKTYVGSFDPDAPGRQEERALHKRIADKFMAGEVKQDGC